MNAVIGAGVGLMLGIVGVAGGISAYQGQPEPVSQEQLFTYADN